MPHNGKLPYVTYAGTPDSKPTPSGADPEPKHETECGDMACFKTLDDVPECYRPAVEKLMAAGALQGTGGGRAGCVRGLLPHYDGAGSAGETGLISGAGWIAQDYCTKL